MKSQIAAIAWKEFCDRFRSGWVLGCILVWLAAVGLTSFFGLIQVGKIGFQGYDRTVLSLLNLVQYLAPLLALLLGHDLIISEREERTLACLIANGVPRSAVLLGKFLGAAGGLCFSLLLGFGIAGAAVGFASRDRGVAPFLLLTGSGLVLGVVFLAVSLAISSAARSRVQALVVSVLVWGGVVFAFDLVALGLLVAVKAPVAQNEIDIICDPTHVNAVAANVHAAFEAPTEGGARAERAPATPRWSWAWVNPVDLFRALNMSRYLGRPVPWAAAPVCAGLWITLALAVGAWKLRSIDL